METLVVTPKEMKALEEGTQQGVYVQGNKTISPGAVIELLDGQQRTRRLKLKVEGTEYNNGTPGISFTVIRFCNQRAMSREI
ncbi:MAG: hypothetical protein AB7U41_00725 [Dongiaceae bacterium]